MLNQSNIIHALTLLGGQQNLKSYRHPLCKKSLSSKTQKIFYRIGELAKPAVETSQFQHTKVASTGS